MNLISGLTKRQEKFIKLFAAIFNIRMKKSKINPRVYVSGLELRPISY